jgi:uncharacterized lipoprotein
MRSIPGIAIAAAAMLLGGCASDLTCQDPQTYQSAREVDRVVAPEGLDELQAAREMVIPRASPRDPRPADAPCLDLPPTIKASGQEEQ